MQDSSSIEVIEPPHATPHAGEVGDEKYFTLREYRRLLNVARVDPRDFWYSAIQCAWCTGLRLKEIALLRWDCINWDDETLTALVSTGAGRPAKTLHIPLAPDLYDRLHAARAFACEKSPARDFVHPAMAASYAIDGHKTISAQFIHLCHKAGILDKSFLCFRRTFIRDLLLAGVDYQAISGMTGIVDLRRIVPNLSLPLDAKHRALLRLSGYRNERQAA